MDADIVTMLEQRLGRLHARQRLGIEREFEGKVFGRGLKLFHLENWYSAPISDPHGAESDRALCPRAAQRRSRAPA